jgi:adenylate cyclase
MMEPKTSAVNSRSGSRLAEHSFNPYLALRKPGYVASRHACKAEAAQSLKCSHVLDGSIRRAAGRVRISAHLVESSSHTTLWSDRSDRGLEDMFALQDETSETMPTKCPTILEPSAKRCAASQKRNSGFDRAHSA